MDGPASYLQGLWWKLVPTHTSLLCPEKACTGLHMEFWQTLPTFNGTINTHYFHVVPEGTRRHWYKTDRKSVLDIGPFGRVTPPPVEVASTSISATSQVRIPSVTPESNQSVTSKSAQQRKQSSSFKTDSEFTVLNLSTQIQTKSP